MSRERWLRRGDETVPFDRAQARLASDLGVPPDLAHALYIHAAQRARDAADAEALYLRYLRATARQSAAATELPVPGRQTRVLHEAARGEGAPAPRDVAHLAPGRWTRVLQEYPTSDPRPPGFDEVHGALGALVAGHAHRSEAVSGAADAHPHRAAAAGAWDGASPHPLDASSAMTTSNRTASALSRLRLAAGRPDRSDGASPSGPGTQLPAEIAARLAPHVGRDAAGAARLHTDDAADQIAAAHHARALTLGVDVYFARGEYAPGTERGDELLVHELTHVAQARRGELTRAAAKGLASGGTLDPAEAEADLRARLAVIELHPPDGAAPSLAPPQGQPTSGGERSARLAAQQHRLGMAGQAEAPLTVPPAPPATRSEAPVPHPPPQMARPPAPASTGNAYVDALSAPPSKQGLELWAGAGAKATTQTAADQARFDAALPPMPVVLDGGATPGHKAGAGGGHAPAPPPARGQTPPAAQPTPTPPAPAVTTAATAARAIQPSATKEQLKTDGQQLIDNLPTTAPDVKTDPGPAPVTDLAGQADPVRSIGDHQHAIGEGARALDAARTRIVTGPGPAQVQPVKLDEKLHVPKEQTTGAMPQLPTVPGMTKLKQWNLPGSALAAFDTVARPKMDAGLAQARARMTESDARRDADRDKAVSDAQDKVKQLHTDADKQQQAKIAGTRTQIANHQADTLIKHEAAIKQLDAQSSDRKKTALGKINVRIAADQARAEADYKAAQQQAEDKKKQGEEQARKKKAEAQNKQQDESWWDQATDALCDAIKSIADEIDQVLDAIGQAVGQILDAVKDAACKAIDAARDFVCQALTEFGDWLKSQIDALIGSVFPELAAALDQLIDGAIDLAKAAVTAIVDSLKQAVTALCDSLKASLDGIIAAFKAAVQAAATFAQAVVTGNWALVGKMILDGILNALGIDPAAFHALIGEAEDSIEKIVQNPGAFVGHLIDAVKLGFKQFGAHFWTHLKDGLVQWLFGTFASAGITMPASFDIAGIFDLVCQVLGLTWPRLRGKVVKLIGEKNTERLEFVAQYVQALITGGFAGLWEKIQGDLSNLWDMVVGGIRDWLIQSVVMAAIEKIATMWNPAGAIFELIKTAWNVYQWVRENAQRIFGLVQAVVHSISNIVAGNIGGAANFIEASLAKLVPVAISLFADLLGLGGLADKIREIIEKVQDKVDHAIDKLIDRVMKLFKGKDGKDGLQDVDKGSPEAQAKLKTALDQLRPRIEALLEHGIPEEDLLAHLDAWKSEFRLTALELQSEGDEFTILAKVNPSGSPGGGKRLSGPALRTMIREIAKEIDDHGIVKSHAQAQFTTGQTATKSNPLQIEPGVGVLAQSNALRQLPALPAPAASPAPGTPSTPSLKRSRPKYLRRPTQFGNSPVLVYEEAGGPDNTLVYRNNQYIPPYQNVVADIQKIKTDLNVTDRRLALLIREMVRYGHVPKGYEKYTAQFQELQRLLFASEAARDSSDDGPDSSGKLYAAMGLDLIGRGNLTFEQFLADPARTRVSRSGKTVYNGGDFPPSIKGAVRLQKLLPGSTGPTSRNKRMQDLAQRQENLIEAWLNENKLYDLCVSDLAGTKVKVRERLFLWFGSRMQLMQSSNPVDPAGGSPDPAGGPSDLADGPAGGDAPGDGAPDA